MRNRPLKNVALFANMPTCQGDCDQLCKHLKVNNKPSSDSIDPQKI